MKASNVGFIFCWILYYLLVTSSIINSIRVFKNWNASKPAIPVTCLSWQLDSDNCVPSTRKPVISRVLNETILIPGNITTTTTTEKPSIPGEFNETPTPEPDPYEEWYYPPGYQDYRFHVRNFKNLEYSTNCSMLKVPDNCTCLPGNELRCYMVQLRDVISEISPNVVEL